MSRGKRLVTRIQWVLVAIWTALSLGAYAVVNVIGDALIRNSDQLAGDPETVVFIFNSLDVLQKTGFGLILASWAVGTLIVLAVGWLIRRALD